VVAAGGGVIGFMGFFPFARSPAARTVRRFPKWDLRKNCAWHQRSANRTPIKSFHYRQENFGVAHANIDKTKAESILAMLAAKPLRNQASGVDAFINTTQANKLVSNAAVNKSMTNGFTREQHYALVCMIETLWNEALEVVQSTDKNHLPGICMKRFAVLFLAEGQQQYVVMTVKATAQHGQRIYSLEAHTEKTLRGMLDKARTETGSTLTPSRSVAAILDALQRKSTPLSLSVTQDIPPQ